MSQATEALGNVLEASQLVRGRLALKPGAWDCESWPSKFSGHVSLTLLACSFIHHAIEYLLYMPATVPGTGDAAVTWPSCTHIGFLVGETESYP